MAADSEKEAWVRQVPTGEPSKDALGRLVERDHDDAEMEYYEEFADPTFVAIETQRRRYRGMLRRRLRHLRGGSQRSSR